MASSCDALPALKLVPTPEASELARKKVSEANGISFSESPWASTADDSSIAATDDDDDDASVCSRSSVIDDVVCARVPIRRPGVAKPSSARPLVRSQLRGSKVEDGEKAQQLTHSSSEAEATPHSNSSTTDLGASKTDATVSDRRAEETLDGLPRLRRRRLDPLTLRSSLTTTGVSVSSTESISPADGEKKANNASVVAQARRASRAMALTIGNRGRILSGGLYSTLPTKPTSPKPANLRASFSASSCGTDAPASSGSQVDLSPPSEVVMMQRADANGSGLAYNLVQFKASPTLSTSQGAGRLSQSISSPRKKRGEEEEAKTPEVCDKRNVEEVLKQTFRGWSKREVKAALRGTYSSEEIADVLEALGLKTPNLDAKKWASS